MQVDVLKGDAELWKRVQRGFLGAPVEFGAPVFRELTQIRDVGAVSPGFAWRRIRKARPCQTIAQVGNVGVRDMQRERRRLACHVHPSCRRCALRTYIALSASSSALPASA